MRAFALLALAGIVAMGAVAVAAEKKGAPLSLDPEKGYFHQVHTKQIGMQCNACHGSGKDDVLFLRHAGRFPGAMQVNRALCLGCHNAPGQPTWYGLKK
jgi:hypothetical protein